MSRLSTPPLSSSRERLDFVNGLLSSSSAPSVDTNRSLHDINDASPWHNGSHIARSEYSRPGSAFSRSATHTPHMSMGSHGQSSSTTGVYYQHVEPAFSSFLCPIAGKIMTEPVIIPETGETYEKSCIESHIRNCKENGTPLVCPVSERALNPDSIALIPNLALQRTIEEWASRSDTTDMLNLSIALMDAAVLSDEDRLQDVLRDMCALCSGNHGNKRHARNHSLIPLIAEQLTKGEEVRCAALETLHILSQDEDDNKVAIGDTNAIERCLRCLSRHVQREEEAALNLMAELSKHALLREKMGGLQGFILSLIGLAHNNALSADKAEEVLHNLEGSDLCIRKMAENGRLLPLLNRFIENDDRVLEFASYLADTTLSMGGKMEVARQAGSSLVTMLDGDTASKLVAIKCLSQLSTLPENGACLVEAGVLQPLVRELSSNSLNPEQMKVKELSATILANVVNSGVDLMTLSVSNSWEAIIDGLLQLLSSPGFSIEGKILQVFTGLAASRATVPALVRSIVNAQATDMILKLLGAETKETRYQCVKLLYLISPSIGQALADGLCAPQQRGLGILIDILKLSGITEEHANTAGFLANLPHSDMSLTQLMLKEEALAVVAWRLHEQLSRENMQVGGSTRYNVEFKLGLATILCRFTYKLDDETVVHLAQEHDLTSLFTELLRFGEVADQIKIQSASALANLSSRSKGLCHGPKKKKKGGGLKKYFAARTEEIAVQLCPLHGGVCSAKDTFCLVDAQAVGVLGSNLDHQNVEVVEACLGTLATLLDEATADTKEGVAILNRARLIPVVVNIMKFHRSEMLWQHSVWMVDKFLISQHVEHFFSLDPSVHVALVEAYQQGNESTKQAAERALRKLKRI